MDLVEKRESHMIMLQEGIFESEGFR